MRISSTLSVWLGAGLLLAAWLFSNVFLFDSVRLGEDAPEGHGHFAVVVLMSALLIARSAKSKGMIEDRLQRAILTTFTVFGIYALLILIGRLYFSRSLLISTVPTVLALSFAVIWISSRRNGVSIALLSPLIKGLPAVPGGATVIEDPATDFRRFDVVLVDLEAPVSSEWSLALSRAMLCGCRIRHVWDYLEELSGAASLEHFELDHVPSLEASPYIPLKRVVDVGVALLLVPLVFPTVVLAGVAIWISSGRPVFFVQERAGLGGEPFCMWKLRTMRPLRPGEAESADALAHARITKVGAFLRRMRIDELPQLWNVLKGEMSLIGPRPEAMSFHRAYTHLHPKFAYRCIVRPGITGWAQVNAPPSVSADEAAFKLTYDLYYLKRQSMALDLKIAFRTVWTVLHGGGVK